MENKMMEIKLAITAFFTAAGAALGWQGIMAVVWVLAMMIDYISGTCAAMKAGEWSSKTAREGLWHKAGMIVVVIVASFADMVLGIICEHLPIGVKWTCKLAYIVPPFGGNQVSKIWKGLKAYIEGGSYNVDAEGNEILQYPVFRDDPEDAFWSFVRSTLMGKNSLPEAQEWVDSGFDSLGAKQTAVYQDLREAGVTDRDAYAAVRAVESAEKTGTKSEAAVEREIIRGLDVSAEGKAILYYGTLSTDDKDRLLMDQLCDAGADAGTVAAVLMDIKDADGSAEVRSILADAALTSEEKQKIFNAKVSDSRDEDVAEFKAVGLDFDNFLDVYDAHERIYDSDQEGGLKALEFAHWLNGQNFSDRQNEVIRESFNLTTQTARYDEMVEAGMMPDDAYELAEAMEELEPPEGKTSVADIQKWKLCVEFTTDVNDQMTALYAVMTEAQYQKVEIANNLGVMPSDYVKFQEIKPQFDADGNGSYKQAEIKAAIDSMTGCSTAQKAVLWQLAVSSSTKAGKNPYSKKVGQSVVDARAAAKEAAKQSGSSFEDAITSQW